MKNQQYLEQLFNSMRHLRRLMETQESHEERVATIMQFSALTFLKSHKEYTVGDLANHLRLSKSSATQLVQRLVKIDCIERMNDKSDRRIIHLAITPTGEKKIKDLKKKYLDRMEKIFSKIPDQDLKELVRIHTNLVEELQKEDNK